jgi:hypothetical protein
MTGSINQPWAISEKFANKYGKTWSNLDFIIEQNISNEQFKTDPMNVMVGSLKVAGREIHMKYKNLISESLKMQQLRDAAYVSTAGKDQKYAVTVAGSEFQLKKHEIGKLSATLDIALTTVQRGYAVGRYL